MSRSEKIISFYSGAVLGLWALFFLSLLVFNTLQYQLFLQTLSVAAERFAIPALCAGLLIIFIRSSLQTRVIIANCLVAIMVALYSVEFYLAYHLAAVQRQAMSATNGKVDSRTKIRVIKDMRAEHIDAYPIIRAENLLLPDSNNILTSAISAGGKPLLPMASIPGTVVVSCNETGQWQIYQADRHGFNNDDSQWDTPTAIGMVGDSFTHGSCVQRDQNMAAYLGRQFGGIINLGVGGFGPMLELAALSEYLRPQKPPVVLWVFFEGNDLNENLPFENRAPILQRYLHDAGFSQDLIHRSGEIKTVLRRYLDQKMTEAMNRVDGPYENLVRYLSLDRLREAIGVGPIQIGYNFGDLNTEIAQYREVMEQANQRVKSWGGQLYLVYFPESDRYLSEVGDSLVRKDIYQGVKNIAAEERIPFIDVAAAFAKDASPGTLYAYPGSHCSARGYQVAAATIAGVLAAHHVARKK